MDDNGVVGGGGSGGNGNSGTVGEPPSKSEPFAMDTLFSGLTKQTLGACIALDFDRLVVVVVVGLLLLLVPSFAQPALMPASLVSNGSSGGTDIAVADTLFVIAGDGIN